MERQHDTLVILGSHPGTRDEFDWKRIRDVDIWSFNEAVSIGRWVKHASAIFQMHIPAIWRNPANRNDNKHAAWLVGGETPPVYMQEKYSDVPQAIEYPLEAVIATLLPNFHVPPSAIWDNRGGFFTSSVDFALALGIYLGYPRIELYGCEMAFETEYMYQRPGFTFWVGMALGRGITIDYHGSIFNVPLYGYEGDIYLPRRLFDQRVIELQHYCQEATITYQARKEEVHQVIQQLVERKVEPAAVHAAISELVKAVQMYAMHDGALQENERYIKKIESMIGAAGDFRISRTEFETAKNMCFQNRQKAIGVANAQAEVVQKAFDKLTKADGYKKRLTAAAEFEAELEAQIHTIVQVAGYDKAGIENMRYMQILDEKYRAAGGAKSVEVLENLN